MHWRTALADVAAQRRADVGKCGAHTAGYALHACCGRKCQERYNQRVLDNVLAILVVDEGLQSLQDRAELRVQWTAPLWFCLVED